MRERPGYGVAEGVVDELVGIEEEHPGLGVGRVEEEPVALLGVSVVPFERDDAGAEVLRDLASAVC